MLRIDFIQWDLLWSATPTVTFTSNNILAYSNNGEAIADLYFNQADASYMDFVIDWSDISAYWDYLPLTNRYPLVWKYGCKVYNDNVLVYTGVIFLDTVRIDKEAFRFAFTLLSTTGFMTRANQDFQWTIPTSDTVPWNVYALISELWHNSTDTPFDGIAVSNRPTFQQAGQSIISPFFVDLQLPSYHNDYHSWLPEYDFGWENPNYVHNQRFQVGIFPVWEWGVLAPPPENKLCFFMFDEYYTASSPFLYDCRVQIIIFDGIGNARVMRDVHHFHRSTSVFNLADYDLHSILRNADLWLGMTYGTEYAGDSFLLRSYGFYNDVWQYAGLAAINTIQVDPDNANVNPFQAMTDLLFLRQAGMVNDPAGNVLCKIRPILNDPQGSVSITNAAIGNPTYSGVFIKSVASNIGLNFLLNITDVLNYIKQYFQTILNWYRVKLSITIDGSVDVGLGTKIMYNNHDYVVTRMVTNYDAVTTDIEAYGVV